MLQKISKVWDNACIVAAPGPSLTKEVAEQCRGFHVVAVNDAHRLFPFADVLYGCDPEWWNYYLGVPEFRGEKWSSHGDYDDKTATAAKHRLRLVHGKNSVGFSFNCRRIHYGDNSGFQAINLAGHKIGWNGTIVLVGFDMRMVDGKRHFFGEHPDCLRKTTTGYTKWKISFNAASKALPPNCKIINCTPDSALQCFPMKPLRKVLDVFKT